MSHIHCGPPGVNGPMNGCPWLTVSDVADAWAGEAYVNVRTSASTVGQVRAQIMSVPPGSG